MVKGQGQGHEFKRRKKKDPGITRIARRCSGVRTWPRWVEHVAWMLIRGRWDLTSDNAAPDSKGGHRETWQQEIEHAERQENQVVYSKVQQRRCWTACGNCVRWGILSALIRRPYSRLTTAAAAARTTTMTTSVRRPCQQWRHQRRPNQQRCQLQQPLTSAAKSASWRHVLAS